jgi:alpha-ribazole phosphatase
MRFILVRHGQTQANQEQRYLGSTCSPYTSLGLRQNAHVLKLLAREKIDRIYASPRPRALGLAESVAKHLGKGIEIQPALAEMGFGVFEGSTYLEAAGAYPKEWQCWTEDYIHYQIPQGESFLRFHQRVTGFLDTLESEGTYLIISHGGVICSAITHLLGLGVDARWHFQIPPGCLVELVKEREANYMRRLVPYEEE